MWGGRFAAGSDALMQAINLSLPVDKRLARHDLAASQAHAAMLTACGIISPADGAAIAQGLEKIAQEIESGTFPYDEGLEDIHMNVEARLKTLIGAAAGRLHTARSRNDQVATDFRLWTRDALDTLDEASAALLATLLRRAEAEAATPMPGFTHLQPAQPVTLGHHLLAYVEMLHRDRGRLHDARQRLNESPLGAAALAGTGFAIDREMSAQALGFARPMGNAMDAVSARDFLLEFMSASAIMMTHLSRLAEELVLWSSPAFGFIQLADAWSTGSSIMPQKRNPDAAELVRAKASQVAAALTALLSILKALPLSYAKDLQDDKPLTFDVFDKTLLSIRVMDGMLGSLQVQRDAMRDACQLGYLTATDLADWLVRELQLPFREAHEITGKAVALAEAKGLELAAVPLQDLQALHAGIHSGVYEVLSLEASLNSRRSYGGTAPAEVKNRIAQWKTELGI
jgi:argininosuccinate lyase